jgi:hypothetical protein
MKSKTRPSHSINDNSAVKLKTVTKPDHRFLYTLLGERHPNANISHKKMPSYNEHVKFVTSKPYSKWYVINYQNQSAGSIYLTKNDEIGIFIKKGFQGIGLGNLALHLLIKANPRPRYLANVNPKNLKSIEFFKKNQFKLIQYTYELISHDMH